MRSAHDETLHLRLPAALRADLDGAARASGGKLSPIARRALALGLKALRPNDDDHTTTITRRRPRLPAQCRWPHDAGRW